MSLQEFCQRRVVAISPRSNIADACHQMAQNNIGCMVVQENGKLCGILTDRDIALKVAGEAKDARQTKVGDVMTSNPLSISVDKNLRDLTRFMHTNHVRRVPIVDGGNKVLGIVTLDDVLTMLSGEIFEIGKPYLKARRSAPRNGCRHGPLKEDRIFHNDRGATAQGINWAGPLRAFLTELFRSDWCPPRTLSRDHSRNYSLSGDFHI